MRIIPVIDILNSKVVQGIRGERDKYFPIKSVFCDSADILDVVSQFVKLFNFKEVYIADLDAITKNKENFNYINKIHAQFDIKIILDAGISTIDRARKIINHGVNNLIIGTETLTSVEFIKDLKEKYSFKDLNLIISIDLYKGKNLTKCHELKDLSVPETINYFQNFDIDEFIILDLSRVGSKSGGISNLVYQVLDITKVKIITGGGIKSIDDLNQLKNTSIDGILIATALHNGSIKQKDIKDFFQ